MFLSPLLASLVSLAAAPNPDPTFAVTAHPFGLIAFPLVGDEEETITHVQIDVVHKPAVRFSPVAHLALTRLTADFDKPDDFEKSTLQRYALELGARYRIWPERGWYAEGVLGYLIETYESNWLESVEYNWQTKTATNQLYGKVDNTFQQPYAMVYAGWASDPSKRLRWDVGIGLGYAFLGGTDDLHDVAWTGNPALADKEQSVDLFAAAPLVFDLNFGVGVNF